MFSIFSLKLCLLHEYANEAASLLPFGMVDVKQNEESEAT